MVVHTHIFLACTTRPNQISVEKIKKTVSLDASQYLETFTHPNDFILCFEWKTPNTSTAMTSLAVLSWEEHVAQISTMYYFFPSTSFVEPSVGVVVDVWSLSCHLKERWRSDTPGEVCLYSGTVRTSHLRFIIDDMNREWWPSVLIVYIW